MSNKNLFIKLLFLALLVGGQGHAQVSAYTWASSSGTYTNLTGGTVLATATANALGASGLYTQVYNLPTGSFPFAFEFNGTSYTGCEVSSSGFITFGAASPGTNAFPLSATTAYDGAISAWGKAQNAAYSGAIIGNISWGVVGSAPNREIVFQWKDFRPTSSTTTTTLPYHSYQIRLQETTNEILFVYGPNAYAAGTTNVGSFSQIGLRGPSNTFPTDINNRMNNSSTPFTSSTGGANNSSTQFWSTNSTTNPTPGFPVNGLTYTWTPPTCIAPTALTSSITSYTGATHSWSGPAGAIGYEYEVSTSATPPATGTATASASAISSGLTPNTTYYLHVRANCGAGDYSAWSTSSTFYTGYCLTSTSGSTATRYISNVTTTGGLTNFNNSSLFTLPGYEDNTAITFSQMPSASVNVSVTCQGSVATNTFGRAIWVDWNNDLDFDDAGEDVYFTASAVSGTTIGTFAIPSGQAAGNYRMRVKMLLFGSTVSACGVESNGYSEAEDYTLVVITCFPPTSLTNVTPSTTTADHSWTAPTFGTPSGYEWAVTTSAIPPLSGTATASLTASSTALTANTTYYLHVRTNCGAGDFSSWSTSSFYTGYCIATGTSSSTQITNVTVGGITTLNYTSAGNAGYADFISVTPTSSNYTGQTVNVSVTCNAGQSSGRAIYIDWNNDLVFNSTNERVFNTAGLITGVSSGTFIVPSSQAPGNYRMRVVANSTNPNPISCPSGIDGETEDYIFTVLYTPSCFPAQTLSATGVTYNSANVSWSAPIISAPIGYEWAVTTSATAPASGTATTSLSASATGLASNTLLYLHVRANCDANGFSDWTTISFTTELAPPSNDECATATNLGVISSTPSCTVVELAAATQSLPASCGTGTNDVWYTFTVPASAGPLADVYYSATNNSGSTNQSFQLYTSCGGASIGCSVPQSGIFTVPPGSYALRVYAASTANLNLCVFLAPPIPSNDAICNALTLKPTAGTSLNTYGQLGALSCDNQVTNTSLATASGSTEASCGGTNGKSVWYKFTTPACVVGGVVPFQIEMTTDNALTSFNSKIQLFSSSNGACNGTLTSVACNDDLASSITSCGGNSATTSTLVQSNLMPNTTYFVLVDGWNSESGVLEVSGRALTSPHSATAYSSTQLQISTANMGASLYTYYVRQVGSNGYTISNSTNLSNWPTVANGFSYQTQVMYRCTSSSSQFYRTPIVTVDVPTTAACTAVSTLDCLPNGGGSYTISWDEVPGLYTNGGALSGYIVYYRAVGASGYSYNGNPIPTCAGGTCSYTLTGLNDPAGYEFWIKTRCSATIQLQSNTATCAGAKSAITDVHSFVNPQTETEYVGVSLTDNWSDFGLTFADFGSYYVGINKDNEIYAVKTAEPNMINGGADISFELVPNPTNASTTLTFNNTIKSGTFTVVDAMGRNILSGNISDTNAIELDGSNWNAGVYLICVTTNDKTTMRRLVISK